MLWRKVGMAQDAVSSRDSIEQVGLELVRVLWSWSIVHGGSERAVRKEGLVMSAAQGYCRSSGKEQEEEEEVFEMDFGWCDGITGCVDTCLYLSLRSRGLGAVRYHQP